MCCDNGPTYLIPRFDRIKAKGNELELIKRGFHTKKAIE